MTTTISVINQKGGVGKTTTVINLAASLSILGQNNLVVDLDPQANASSGLGVWNVTPSIDDVMSEAKAGAAISAICKSKWPSDGPQPDLIPGSHLLANREPLLASDPVGAQDRLKLALAGVAHDLIVIDCPPSLGLLSINGLFAADSAVIVTEPAAWAADGVGGQRRHPHPAHVAGQGEVRRPRPPPCLLYTTTSPPDRLL